MMDIEPIGEQHSRSRIRVYDIFKISIALLLLILVLSQIRFADLFIVWQRISVSWLGLVFLSFLLNVWLIARRYWLLIDKEVAFQDVLTLVIMQIAVGNLIATSAGLASYIAILRAKFHIKVSYGFMSVFISKFLDLVVMFTFFFISVFFVHEYIAEFIGMIRVLQAVIFIFIVFVLLVFTFRRRPITELAKLIEQFKLGDSSFASKVMTNIQLFADVEFKTITKNLSALTFYSILIFLVSFIFYYSSMRLFSINLNISALVFIQCVLMITVLIPIQVLGGLGLQEFTSIYLFELFNIPPSIITPVVIGNRIIFIIANLILLLILFIEALSHKRKESETNH